MPSFQDFQFTLPTVVRKLFQMFGKLLPFVFLALPLLATAESVTDPEALFQQGLAAYQKQQFEEARTHFQEILNQNFVSPPVLHNLALASFHSDQKAYALALWRKALAMDSSYKPARAGEEFAEMALQVRAFESDGVQRLVNRSLAALGVWPILWLLAVVIGVCGWIWIHYWSERQVALDTDQPLPPMPLNGWLALGVLVLGIALLSMKVQEMRMTRATVIQNKSVPVRSLPQDEAVSLFELRGGSEVLVKRTEPDWVQVQSSEGSTGWVKRSDILVTSGS